MALFEYTSPTGSCSKDIYQVKSSGIDKLAFASNYTVKFTRELGVKKWYSLNLMLNV